MPLSLPLIPLWRPGPCLSSPLREEGPSRLLGSAVRRLEGWSPCLDVRKELPRKEPPRGLQALAGVPSDHSLTA